MRLLPLGLAAGLLLCGSARGGSGKDESPTRAPVISVDPEGFDFGRVVPGKSLRKEFRIRNAGEQDLVLQPVRTSCGCTAAVVGETTIAAGRSTALTVELRTVTLRGRIVKRVVVPSNDPATPLLEIKIEATIAEPPAK